MKNHFLLIITFLLLSGTVRAQVAINAVNGAPDNSAMLDVASTSKGLLVPRMSAAQRDAITNPATGLLVFCTDNNMYFSNSGTPAAPTWIMVNSKWTSNGANIYFTGGKAGFGTSLPATIVDIAGGNNWDLVSGEGDFRIGNSLYRLKMGLALAGGGAGSAGIMQYGQPGGYNVLKLGAQGNYLLFINGSTQRAGIGTDNPLATFDVHGTFSMVDGTQGAGKVLTSDANGLATWTTEGSSSAHYIGESYGGGIVFYVYDNGRHGLISSLADQTPTRWYGGTNTMTRARAVGVKAGLKNTLIIIANQASVDGAAFAATVCNEFSVIVGGVTYGDWYLPSNTEINLLYQQRAIVGGFNTGIYWSSTEYDVNNAWFQYFGFDGQSFSVKYAVHSVRAIRAF